MRTFLVNGFKIWTDKGSSYSFGSNDKTISKGGQQEVGGRIVGIEYDSDWEMNYMGFRLTNEQITDDFGKKCSSQVIEKTKFNKFVCNDRYAKLGATYLTVGLLGSALLFSSI